MSHDCFQPHWLLGIKWHSSHKPKLAQTQMEAISFHGTGSERSSSLATVNSFHENENGRHPRLHRGTSASLFEMRRLWGF